VRGSTARTPDRPWARSRARAGPAASAGDFDRKTALVAKDFFAGSTSRFEGGRSVTVAHDGGKRACRSSSRLVTRPCRLASFCYESSQRSRASWSVARRQQPLVWGSVWLGRSRSPRRRSPRSPINTISCFRKIAPSSADSDGYTSTPRGSTSKPRSPGLGAGKRARGGAPPRWLNRTPRNCGSNRARGRGIQKVQQREIDLVVNAECVQVRRPG